MKLKKILALLLAAAMLLALVACNVEPVSPAGSAEPTHAVLSDDTVPPPASPTLTNCEEPDPVSFWSAADGITFSLLQDTYPVGTERITLVTDNRTALAVSYGEEISFQRYEAGLWQTVEMKAGIGWRDIAWVLLPGATRTFSIDARCLAHPLEEGLYRVTGSKLYLGEDAVEIPAWQVSFRVSAEAQPEPDYGVFVPGQPIPLSNGCAVTTGIPIFLVNTTGESAQILMIPRLERRNDAGDWEEIPFRDGVGFCGMADHLPAGGEMQTLETNLWSGLEAGTYRVSFQAGADGETNVTASGEFMLCQPEGGGLPPAD